MIKINDLLNKFSFQKEFNASENQLTKSMFIAWNRAHPEQISERHYNWLVNQSLEINHIHYKTGDEQDSDFRDTIQNILRTTIAYHGPGLSYRSENSNPRTDTLIQFLLGRGSLSFEEIDLDILQEMFFTKNSDLSQECQAEIRKILDFLADRLPTTAQQELIFHIAISHIMALLPYSYPDPDSNTPPFTIPLKVEGFWRRLQYRIDQRIDLLPVGTRKTIPAFGLISDDLNAPPLLSFLGTTYPTGDGFFATLIADCTPGYSVGEAPYRIGHEKIKQWFNGKTNVRLFGLSLGGTIALHTLRDFVSQIGEVNIHNPPGLPPTLWTQPYDDPKIKVNIFYQENDLVATMGTFPSGQSVSIYRILAEKPRNMLSAHTQTFTDSKTVLITKSSPEFENQRTSRKFLTLLHIITSPIVFLLIIGVYLIVFPFLWIGQACWNLYDRFRERTTESHAPDDLPNQDIPQDPPV